MKSYIILTPSLHLGNVYIADYYNQRIRKVTVATGIITTIAGSSTSGSYSGDNGQATSAGLYYPTGLALDVSGIFNFFQLYTFQSKDVCHSCLQVIFTSQIVTTVVSAR